MYCIASKVALSRMLKSQETVSATRFIQLLIDKAHSGDLIDADDVSR
jgi:hypothetical protein